MIRSRKKWSESAILKILSPVRLPFRHTGFVDFQQPEQSAGPILDVANALSGRENMPANEIPRKSTSNRYHNKPGSRKRRVRGGSRLSVRLTPADDLAWSELTFGPATGRVPAHRDWPAMNAPASPFATKPFLSSEPSTWMLKWIYTGKKNNPFPDCLSHTGKVTVTSVSVGSLMTDLD